MSKAKSQKPVIEKAASQSTVKSSRQWPDFGIFFIILYLLVEFIPVFQGIDVIGSQWFLLTILNIVVVVFVLVRKNYYQETIKNLFKSHSAIVYVLLIVWGLCSYFYAVNKSDFLTRSAWR
jgi:O-antigen ligase